MSASPHIEIGNFPVPFKIVFKHTSAARAATDNVIVQASDSSGAAGYGEGCPRSYVTGETAESALAFLRAHAEAVMLAAPDVAGLRSWIDANRILIDDNPSAFCALELALLDLFGQRVGQSVEKLLDLPPLSGPFHYSAVLGDSGPLTFTAQVVRFRAGGLRHYKLKLSGDLDHDRAKLRWFAGRVGRVIAKTVRVDANNLWSDPDLAIAHLEALDYPFLGIEEPLKADDLPGFLTIAEALDSRIILDESLLRPGQLDELPGDADRWILNCRVSKSGGLIRSLELIESASQRGLGVIVGAHVGETSILTRAALAAAQAAGPALLAQEGAFGTHLLTEDICDQPLMFGRRGELGPRELATIGPAGLGVSPTRSQLTLRPLR